VSSHDTAIEMRWWLVPATEVPQDRETRIDWLFDWCPEIDDWIAERRDAGVVAL
jgi:hypothetical protein